MKSNLIIFSLLTICGLIHDNCSGQNQKKYPGGGVFFYYKVERYTYNDSNQLYVFMDSILTSKAISIDPVKVYIESYDEGNDYILKIIDYIPNDSPNMNLYICESNNCVYKLLTSTNYQESILMFNNQKYIFYKATDPQKEKETQIFLIPGKNKENPDSIVYVDFSLDIKPKYKNSLNYEASIAKFQQDLETEIKLNCDTTKNGEIILSFIITQEGKISKPTILICSPGKADACIISTINTMTGWTPGLMKDKKVATFCTITINPNGNTETSP